MGKERMSHKNNLQRGYEDLLWRYLISQAYAYVLVGIFFIVRYSFIRPVFIIGWFFIAISIILLLASMLKELKTVAKRLDIWFGGGLFIATASILIIDGLLGTLRTDAGETLFWILIIWLFLLVISNAVVISRRIGIIKFVVFGLAAFGLLMIFAGYNEPIFYIIAIIGLLFSVPILDSILYEKLSRG